MRLRPTNFPTIRLSQFASLINRSKHLFSKTIEARESVELEKLYTCEASSYWNLHFSFTKSSTSSSKKKLGKTALLGILINTVIPFLFIYGDKSLKSDLKHKALELMQNLPAERNSILTLWDDIGIKALNAAQGQALIHLKNMYCDEKNCLYCQIGNSIIRN